MPKTLSAVDAYIAKAKPFAVPILEHLRGLMHKAVPDVVEEMKWSRPFFVHRGIILGNISAFKEHCSFGLWGEEIAAKLRADGVLAPDAETAMGSFGRLTSVKDLPKDKVLLGYIKMSAAAIDAGTRTVSYKRPQRVAKPAPVEVPADLIAALKRDREAQANFAAFSPSCQKEYIDWIVTAKREETREARIEQTVEWVAEGKKRNWKYEAS